MAKPLIVLSLTDRAVEREGGGDKPSTIRQFRVFHYELKLSQIFFLHAIYYFAVHENVLLHRI